MIRILLTGLFGATAAALCPFAAHAADQPLSQAAPQPAAQFTRCESTGDSIEYRSYLPDQRRYLFVSIKVLHGVQPSVFVIIDKNFDSKGVDLSKTADPIILWWLDRTRPFVFSSDKIKVTWVAGGVWNTITGWIGTADVAAVTQPIRGLELENGRLEGTGTRDTNSYAYQSRIELPDFSGDELAVAVPAVSYDGITVAPPPVHFTNTDETPSVKC